MPLHYSKRTALLNSLNCISSNDLTSLKDLSDGICLMNILTTTFNEPSDHTEKHESTNTSHLENDEISRTKSDNVENVENPVLDIQPMDVSMTESENANTNENCSQESVLELVESPNAVDKTILQRFNFIKNFINEKYNLKSEEIIVYPKCISGNEFELAKVAIFILSEVVRHFVVINNDHLRTLAHLDVRVQEDLEECFHLLISERESISKKDVEKLLNNHAKYKSRSPKSPFATPRRNCASKYRFDFSTTPTNEEVYNSSPLKSFFESPLFKKEDILLKEKEIVKTRNDLHAEELKSEELQLELKNAEQKIEERDKEIKALKAALKEQESDKKVQNLEDELIQLREKYCSLEKESSHKFKDYEKEIADLLKQNRFLEFEAKKSQGFARYINLKEEDLLYELIHKDTLLGKKNEMVTNYRLKQSNSFVGIDKMQSMLDTVTEELAAEKERYKCLEMQATKELELYATKLSELKQAIKKEPDSPGTGENLGVIIEEENRILQLKLDSANLKIKQLQQKLQDTEQSQENNVPKCKNAFNRSVVEILDLAETPRREKISLKKHTSALEILDLHETPKVKKRHSKKSKELTDLPAVCDTSSNSEIVFKNSPSSLHSEEVPFTENTNEPVLEEIGTLWKNMEDSHLEIENTDSTACISDLNSPENCDRLLNKSVSLCSLTKYNIPNNKNGYKFSTAHFERSGNILQELKKKDEEIDNLKATCEILQTQSEDYLEKINKNIKTIEDLENMLSQMKKAYETRCQDYIKCNKRLHCYKEKAENYDVLLHKYKNMELNMRKSQEMFRYEIKALKSSRNKKDQEIICLKGQMKQLMQEKTVLRDKNENLERKVKMLENQRRENLRKLKEAEEKLEDMITADQRRWESRNIKKNTRVEVNSRNKEQAANCNSDSYFIPLNTDASIDTNNESTLSCALSRRNGLPLDSFLANGEDEDSFFNHTSLPCPNEQQENRFEELIRRNSILPQHLQSSYPVEMNLTPSVDKFYFRNSENVNSVNPETNESGYHSKKRKIEELDGDCSGIASSSTPLTKERKIFKTPSSLKKLLQFKRSRRNGCIKPKP